MLDTNKVNLLSVGLVKKILLAAAGTESTVSFENLKENPTEKEVVEDVESNWDCPEWGKPNFSITALKKLFKKVHLPNKQAQ